MIETMKYEDFYSSGKYLSTNESVCVGWIVHPNTFSDCMPVHNNSRDIIIILGVFILFINNLNIVIKPSITSKITTCFQFFTVIAGFTRGYSAIVAGSFGYFVYITALLTIISGLHYMHTWFQMMGEGIVEN